MIFRLRIHDAAVPSCSRSWCAAGSFSEWEFGHGGWNIWSGGAVNHPQYVGFEPRAFFADEDVIILEPVARCIYLAVLARQMLTGTLPDDPERIRAVLQIPAAAWDPAWESFEHLFEPLGEGRIGHPRMFIDHTEASHRAGGCRESGSAGGKASGEARRKLASLRNAAAADNQSDPSSDPSGKSKRPLNVGRVGRVGREEKEEKEENTDRAAKPAREPEPISAEVAEVMQALETYLGEALDTKTYLRNAKQVSLLISEGGLQDPNAPDRPKAPPQPAIRIAGALRWLGTQPRLCTKTEFSWRPQIQCIRTLRQKWRKLEDSSAAAVNGSQHAIIDAVLREFQQ